MEQFIAFLKGWRLKIFIREAKVAEMLKGRRIAGCFMLGIYFFSKLADPCIGHNLFVSRLRVAAGLIHT